MVKYFNRISVAFSILLNCILGGKSNQTFSARNWQRQRDGKLNLVWLLDLIFLKRGHCSDSWIKWTLINNSITNYNENMGFGKKRNVWE